MSPTEFCGCDPEANHTCERHLGNAFGPVFHVEPVQSVVRKTYPVTSGVLDYFPLAIMEVAHVSWAGNQQHYPADAPLHWDRSKSSDEADALLRHFIQRGTKDTDGIRHSAKVAWRALAFLQKELEAAHESH